MASCEKRENPEEERSLLEKELTVLSREKIPESADVLMVRERLALTGRELGKPEESYRLLDDLLPDYQRVLGPEHPDTLGLMESQASVSIDMQKPEEALQRYEELLPRLRKVLGDEHPDTLLAKTNLTTVYMMLDRAEEARELCEELLPAFRKVYGPDHRLTLFVSVNLAWSFRLLGDTEKSCERFEELIPVLRQAMGTEHPQTLRAMRYLITVYRLQAQAEKALELGGELLSVLIKLNGPEHPDTLDQLANQAVHLSEANKQEEARQSFEDLIPVLQRVIGAEHTDTLRAMANLASVYRVLDRAEEARERCEKLLPVLHRVCGSDAELTLFVSGTLALSHDQLGAPDKAIEIFEECLPVIRQKLGSNHLRNRWALRHLAYIHQRQGNVLGMEKIYRELSSLDLTSPSLAGERCENFDVLSALAGALADWPRAAEFCRERLKADNQPISFHNYCAMAALMNGDRETYAAECAAMLGELENRHDIYALWLTAVTCLMSPDPATDLAACTRFAADAHQINPVSKWALLALAMADFRNGNMEEAFKRFQIVSESTESQLSLHGLYFLAMCHYQLGNPDAARSMLADTNQRLQPILQRDLSMGWVPNGWARTAAILLLRAEAERMILGAELSPPVTMASLLEAYSGLPPVAVALRRGREAALKEQWPEASRAFAEAFADPAFEWTAAEWEVIQFWNWVQVAIARHKDNSERVAICQNLAASLERCPPSKDRTFTMAITCIVPADPPAELLELAQTLLEDEVVSRTPIPAPPWRGVFFALLYYRLGDYQAAYDWARQAAAAAGPMGKARALLVQSMAAKRMGLEEEALALFQQAAPAHLELKKLAKQEPERNLPALKVFECLLDEAKDLLGVAEAP